MSDTSMIKIYPSGQYPRSASDNSGLEIFVDPANGKNLTEKLGDGDWRAAMKLVVTGSKITGNNTVTSLQPVFEEICRVGGFVDSGGSVSAVLGSKPIAVGRLALEIEATRGPDAKIIVNVVRFGPAPGEAA